MPRLSSHPITNGLQFCTYPGLELCDLVYGNPGTLGGGATIDVNQATGFPCLKVTTTYTDYANFPQNPSMQAAIQGSDQVTIVVWADLVSVVNNGTLLLVPAQAGWADPYAAIQLSVDIDPSGRFRWASGGAGTLRATSSFSGFVSASDPPTMYAASKQLATAQLYRNGLQVQTGVITAANQPINMGAAGGTRRDIYIARTDGSGGESTTGDFMMAAIWHRPLTADEHRILYNDPTILIDQRMRRRSASGTVNNITPSGSITATGFLDKDVTKRLLGTVTPTGVLDKDVAKLLTGSSTPSGLVRKFVTKTTSGSITPAGTMLRTTGKILVGSITATGFLDKDVAKKMVGTITPTGIVAKAITKRFTGSTTPAGALSTQVLKLLALAGSITATGFLRKDTTKKVTGSVTATGVVKKDVAKRLTGSITAAGSIANQILKQIFPSGSITATGFLRKATSKTLAGTQTSSGVVKKDVSKRVTGSITPTGALTQLISKVIALAGVIATTGSLRKAVTHKETGSITPTGVVQKSMTKTFVGSITATGKVVKSIAARFVGTITSTGVLSKSVAKTVRGTITAVGQLITSGGAPVFTPIVGILRTFGNRVLGSRGHGVATTREASPARTTSTSGPLRSDGTISMNTREE